MTDPIKIIARALVDNGRDPDSIAFGGKPEWMVWERDARAILAALAEAGIKMWEREPTIPMRHAMLDKVTPYEAAALLRAAWDAAPPLPAPPDPDQTEGAP